MSGEIRIPKSAVLVVGAIVLAFVGAVLALVLPDIKREIRIMTM